MTRLSNDALDIAHELADLADRIDSLRTDVRVHAIIRNILKRGADSTAIAAARVREAVQELRLREVTL